MGNVQHRRGTRPRQPGPQLREITCEGYGPGGTAVIVTCATEDPEAARTELRGAFARHGGDLGAAGSVAYLFNEVGLLSFPRDGDAIVAAGHAAGAEEVCVRSDGSVEVLTDPRELTTVREALERAGLRAAGAEVTRRSAVRVKLDERDAAAMLGLLEALQNVEGVRDVYTNADVSAEPGER